MIGAVIALAVALAAAVGGLITFGLGWARAERGRGDEKAEAANLRGRLELAAKTVEQANHETKEALAAEKDQEARGDDLERELADETTNPVRRQPGLGGLAGLSSLAEDEPLPRRDR